MSNWREKMKECDCKDFKEFKKNYDDVYSSKAVFCCWCGKELKEKKEPLFEKSLYLHNEDGSSLDVQLENIYQQFKERLNNESD
jgi:hypothetical protein